MARANGSSSVEADPPQAVTRRHVWMAAVRSRRGPRGETGQPEIERECGAATALEGVPDGWVRLDLRMSAPMVARPAIMRIQVDGSGTGVKLRSSALPFSETKKLPPPRRFWKPLVLTEKSSGSNPEIDPALTSVHE